MKTVQDRIAPDLQTVLMELTRRTLTPAARIGHILLLFAAVGMSALLLALLLGEPALPVRTQLAFGVLLAIGIAWTGYAVWVLRHRRPLLAGHRIVAGWMALGFTTLLTVGAAFMSQSLTQYSRLLLVTQGVTLAAIALIALIGAYRRRAQLLALKRGLEDKTD